MNYSYLGKVNMNYAHLDLSDKSKYNYLLDYIFRECDEVTFHFPVLEEYKYVNSEFVSEYKKYMDEKQIFLNELFYHGAKQEKSKVYQGIRLGYYTKIIRTKIYPELIDKFKKHHLYDWLWWNVLPEDPCFFSGEKRRFLTVSHEEIFEVCDAKRDHLLIQQMTS